MTTPIKTPWDREIASMIQAGISDADEGYAARALHLGLQLQEAYRRCYSDHVVPLLEQQAQLVDSLRALYTLVASNWPGDKVKILAKAQATLVAVKAKETDHAN